jgi:hypothetical protein
VYRNVPGSIGRNDGQNLILGGNCSAQEIRGTRSARPNASLKIAGVATVVDLNVRVSRNVASVWLVILRMKASSLPQGIGPLSPLSPAREFSRLSPVNGNMGAKVLVTLIVPGILRPLQEIPLAGNRDSNVQAGWILPANRVASCVCIKLLIPT